jgi:hypothetical protein
MNGNDARVAISQRFTTIPGETYKVRFLAAARDHRGILEIRVHHPKLKPTQPILEATLENLQNRDLEEFVFEFTASAEVTELIFSDIDKSKKTYGVLLDGVTVFGSQD